MVTMRKRRFTAVGNALSILEAGVYTTADLFETMMRDRVSSYRMARQKLGAPPPELVWAKAFENRRNFQSLLSKLKREGFIQQADGKGSLLWKVTKLGKTKIDFEKRRNLIEEASVSANPIIVSYDIPERLRNERKWLREVLLLLDYQPVHKSVWIGNKRISENLLRELRKREILNGTQIFEVTKKGTLNRIS